MPRFFVDKPVTNFFEIIGENANHIMRSLRMKPGEIVILCHEMMDYKCKIVGFAKNSVQIELLSVEKCSAEPQVKITLFQGIPKGDKMDLIVQKAVEVGVYAIVPVFNSRCVSRPDQKSLKKKIQRWQKIALEAAKQSGRALVPRVFEAMDFNCAVNFARKSDKFIVFYENGGKSLANVVTGSEYSMAVFVGPEGGFEDFEIEKIKKLGGKVCSLGKRILRTETAAIVSVALVINEVERELN